MRVVAMSLMALLLVGCEQLGYGTGGDQKAASSDAGAAEAGVVGGGCGTESKTGVELCIATSKCPSVVVDTQATPSCGFRVRNGIVDLVCACGTSICPMGTFSTCAEAQKLLTEQTEAG